MKWYMNLSINQKINVKSAFILVTGISFESLDFMFSLKEKIEILYNKLVMESIIVE